MPSAAEDAELIARVLSGNDMDAFGALVARHEQGVRAVLRSLCRNATALVDDLAQDTFVRALGHLHQAKDADRFGAWLASIAYREFLMWRRAQQRYAQVLAEAGQYTEEAQVPDHGVARLERYLSVLNEQEREAIVLNHGAGLSQREVSVAMQLPLGTVKSLISRGKQRIQSAFAQPAEVANHG